MRSDDLERGVREIVVEARVRSSDGWRQEVALGVVCGLTDAGFFRRRGAGGAAWVAEVFAAEASLSPSEALAMLAGAARQQLVAGVESLADRVCGGLESASRLALRDRGRCPAKIGFPDRRAVAVGRAAIKVMGQHTRGAAHTEAAFRSVEEAWAVAARQRADVARRAARALGLAEDGPPPSAP